MVGIIELPWMQLVRALKLARDILLKCCLRVHSFSTKLVSTQSLMYFICPVFSIIDGFDISVIILPNSLHPF